MAQRRKGFRKEPTLYKLKFEDPELDGLEVTVKSLPLRGFLEINRMATDPAQQDQLFTRFAEVVLVDWNIEDEDGSPVKADIEGLLDQEISLINAIIQQWVQVMTSVPKSSNDSLSYGSSSLEESLPMASL